jgi:hypothetical protein
MKDALSPGRRPSFTEPPEKLPLFPVMNPKSSTAELKPCGTFPRSASEKMKFDDRLGACEPVKPFSPEALAFPRGGRSKPIPVMVEVEPGCVMADVFVMVKVNVFVCELNSHTTVAVENWPLSTPAMVIVSAFAVAAPKRIRAQTLKAKFRQTFDWYILTKLPAGCRFPSRRDQELMIATSN